MIKVTLPNGDSREYEKGTKAIDIIKDISEGLARNAICVAINDENKEINTLVNTDCTFKVFTFADELGKEVYRHTTSHILAQAVKRLYPNAEVAIGPAIKDGFYYDIEFNCEFTQEDLAVVEAEMNKIIKENLPITRDVISKAEGVKLFTSRGEKYKIEIMRDLDVESVSIYTQGEYIDMCRGPHLTSTGKVKAVKLLSVAGAYWRGDVKNKMLTRIYGTAFDKKSDLDAYVLMLEEAKKRDHRKLGRELDLFDLFDEGPGFPFYLPKGMILKNKLIEFWREEHLKDDYKEISTPIILNQELWHRSGHWDHYKDNMYTLKIDDEDYAIKPMNCPGGMLVYKRRPHSYRDLPDRMAELGLVHRHELSGALHGLMRVRCFTQDDAHIFMTKEQLVDEVCNVIKLIDRVYSVFGFSYHMELSTMPEDHLGTEQEWEQATNALRVALEQLGRDYVINEGDGAFYGPKIDFHLKDSLGRTWQCGTIQADFQLPERFDLTYVGADGEKHRPCTIHRTVLGSIERFIAILTEHFAGAFPLWLSPVQMRVLPISENNYVYAQRVQDMLVKAGFRSELDNRNEKIGYRIREAQLQKIPYMLVVGDKEQEDGTLSVRQRKNGDLGVKTIEQFIQLAREEEVNKLY
ncbi:MAG: threonine--tRNA ligase [Clostridia bacterium]|nr:threonine--tRNA ligase [Clostridia bacterium]